MSEDRPVTTYRVREAVVHVCNGYSSRRERRFLAERRCSFLGVRFWFPVRDGDWRRTQGEAQRDAENDAHLRRPPSPPVVLHIGA